MDSLFRSVVDENDPEDEPDEAQGSEDVEDGLPAEGVAQDAADGQRYDGAHLEVNRVLEEHLHVSYNEAHREHFLQCCSLNRTGWVRSTTGIKLLSHRPCCRLTRQ